MRVIVRALTLAVVAAVIGFGTNVLSDGGTANIGAGLFAMFGVLVTAFTWGLRDARHAPLGPVLLRWVAVGAVVGLAFAVLPQVGSEEFFSTDLYLDDLPSSGAVGLVLTALSAALGALVGAMLRRRADSAAPATPPMPT